ncbi:protein kintoun [Narcine bancroftii]|uniref:protein kintoun n=1 Tax=Narcine bancroftii TaxID=1343680 RepID=UPI0038316618
MASASKLEELELTREEVDRFSKALKEEKFRRMLSEYAEEISNPENKKKYEEEIIQLEKERGVDVKFVHPIPGHVLKTSIHGDKKCFINVCSNELINKPACKPGRDGDGALGQHWSLPYGLAPVREDVGKGGQKHLICDVVFHPDALYMADRNTKFRKMVDEISLDTIEKQLKAKLDWRNVKTLKVKYKGLPHATVIRKPLPGGHKEISHEDNPLRFPYPYDLPKSENSSQSYDKDESTTDRSNAAGKDADKKSQTNAFTQPKYSIVYRSVFDMQDYRYAREAAPTTRPKELVVTIDLPLLNSAENACLDVTKNFLSLESQKPAYKLELTLPYPVDENQGSAKFNRSKRQLVVTLPVVPSKQDFELEENHTSEYEPVSKDVEFEKSPLKPELNQFEGDSHEINEDHSAYINYEDSNWQQSQSYEHPELSDIPSSVAKDDGVATSISCNNFLKPNDLIVSPQAISEVDSDEQKKHPEEGPSNDKSFHGSLENQPSRTVDGQISEHPQISSSANTECCSEDSLKENELVCPDFHYHQNKSTVTFVLQVKNINEKSLKSVLCTSDYHIMFGTTDSDTLYSLIIQFPFENKLNTRESILNISKDNAAVVLIKSFESQGLWQSFSSGHRHNSLQNKLFVTSENADQFLRSSLNDSIPANEAEKCSAILTVSEVSEKRLVIFSKFQQKEDINSPVCDLNHNTACSTPSNIQQHREEICTTESTPEKETSLTNDGVEFDSCQREELVSLSGSCDNVVQLHSSSEGTVLIPHLGMDQLSQKMCMNPAEGSKFISEVEIESQSVIPPSDLDMPQAKSPISLNNESSVISDSTKRENGDNEVLDEDDLLADQMNDNGSEFVKQTAPFQILEEINPADGSIKVISDHSTHSAFTFQNTELYQLD